MRESTKFDPKGMRLRKLLLDRRMTNYELCTQINRNCHVATKLLTGGYKTIDTDLLVDIANYFEVGINDVYDTGCIKDEENRVKLIILDAILDDVKILAKLRKTFSDNELRYLTEMLKEYHFEYEVMPRHFLTNMVLEADYYTSLPVKLQVKAQTLADKIDDLNELEAFTILNRILKYNSKKEENIDKLLYKEKSHEKVKRKKSIHF